MTQKMIINHLNETIRRKAFRSCIYEHLALMDFDKSMMEFYQYTSLGEAFQAMNTLYFMTEKSSSAVYDEACEEAHALINADPTNIIALLNAAGHDGEHYYKNVTEPNWRG